MNVWINDSTLKAACVNRSLGSSITNKTSFDGSSRQGAWEWVEAIVISGSYHGNPTVGAPPGDNVLTVKVTDAHSQYHGLDKIEISSRHLVGPGRSILPANSFNDGCDLPTDLTEVGRVGFAFLKMLYAHPFFISPADASARTSSCGLLGAPLQAGWLENV